MPVHQSVKKALGYTSEQPDGEVIADWRERTSRVCKPCWELKYCPYGPLVEQSPLLPSERESATSHNEYLKRVLASGKVGSIRKIDKKEKARLQKILDDEKLLTHRAVAKVKRELWIESLGGNPETLTGP